MSNQDRSVKKAGIGYTIGNYLIRGIGFLTLPIFSRLLTTADFGIYNTYSSYESILFVLIGLALHTSFKNAYYKYKEGFSLFVSNCVLIACINAGLFVVFGNIYAGISEIKPHWYMTMLMLHGFATAIIAYYNTFLSINYQSRSYVRIAVINAIGNVALSLILISTVFTEYRGYGRIIGIFIPTFLIAIYLVAKFWKASKPVINIEYIRYALSYSLPLIPHGISQVLLSSCDRIMIASMIGDSEAGLYSFAYTLFSIISVTYSSLDQVWSPWFYEKFKIGDTKLIREVSVKYAFCMSLLTIGIMLVSPEITIILGSKAYIESVTMVVPIMIGGFLSYLYNFPAIIEYYHGRTMFIAGGTMAATVINIILNYVCIKMWGYQAAAYTTLITYALYFVFHYCISYRINEKKHLYDIKKFIAIIILISAAGLICQLLLREIILRWGLAVVDGFVLVMFANKEFDIKKMLKRKLKLQ